MTFEQRVSHLITEFQGVGDWESRYRLLVEKGKKLPPVSDALKTDENLVKGCQSQVWLHAALSSDGKMVLQADGDAVLVRGLVAIALQIYDGLEPQEVLQGSPAFIKEIGFDRNLTPSRANGFLAMLKQIRNYAIAFSYISNKNKSST